MHHGLVKADRQGGQALRTTILTFLEHCSKLLYRRGLIDAGWRDPEDPARVAVGFDLGHHMHGNDAGYRALADSIDLGLFG